MAIDYRNIKKRFPRIFADWHPTLNGKVNPNRVRIKSRKKWWWRCSNKKCGHNWKATIYSRIKLKTLCPKCVERKNRKFPCDIREMEVILKKIKKLQSKIDESITFFLNDEIVKTQRFRKGILARKKLSEINKLGLEFRKMIIKYKHKTNELRKLKK